MTYRKINFEKYTIKIDTGMSVSNVAAYHEGVKVWYDSYEEAERSYESIEKIPGYAYSIVRLNLTRIEGGPDDGAIYGLGGKKHGWSMRTFED